MKNKYFQQLAVIALSFTLAIASTSCNKSGSNMISTPDADSSGVVINNRGDFAGSLNNAPSSAGFEWVYAKYEKGYLDTSHLIIKAPKKYLISEDGSVINECSVYAIIKSENEWDYTGSYSPLPIGKEITLIFVAAADIIVGPITDDNYDRIWEMKTVTISKDISLNKVTFDLKTAKKGKPSDFITFLKTLK